MRTLTWLTAAVLTASTTLLAASASAAGADPLDDAKHDLAQAQAASVAAAQKYSDALSEQARQEAEITRLEQEIPTLRARSAALKEVLRERSVQLYKQHGQNALPALLATDRAEDADRAQELTTAVAKHDSDLAADLTR